MKVPCDPQQVSRGLGAKKANGGILGTARQSSAGPSPALFCGFPGGTSGQEPAC